MQAGKLRKRITIQSPTVGTDPWQTQTQGTWTNVLTCWASIENAKNKFISAGNQQNMQATHVITIRYPGVNYQVAAGYRILYGTRLFSILEGITNQDERNIMLQMYVYEDNPVQGGAQING